MIFFCIHSSVRVRTASAQDGLGVVGRGVGGFAGGEDGGEVGVLRRGAMVGQGLERMSIGEGCVFCPLSVASFPKMEQNADLLWPYKIKHYLVF